MLHQSPEWEDELGRRDREPQRLVLDPDMNTLDKLAYACATSSRDHVELAQRVQEMTKASPCLDKFNDEINLCVCNIDSIHTGPKVLRKAKEQKNYKDLLTDPREEEQSCSQT